MALQTGSQQETVADALARRVEARRGAASRWAEAFRELGAVDRAVYETVARTPTAELDEPVRRLSDAANYARLWLGVRAPQPGRGGGTPGGAGGRGRDRRDLGDRQPRREAPCQEAASGSRRTRAVPGPPGPDARIDLVPLWAFRVGVRVRLRRRRPPCPRC